MPNSLCNTGSQDVPQHEDVQGRPYNMFGDIPTGHPTKFFFCIFNIYMWTMHSLQGKRTRELFALSLGLNIQNLKQSPTNSTNVVSKGQSNLKQLIVGRKLWLAFTTFYSKTVLTSPGSSVFVLVCSTLYNNCFLIGTLGVKDPEFLEFHQTF